MTTQLVTALAGGLRPIRGPRAGSPAAGRGRPMSMRGNRLAAWALAALILLTIGFVVLMVRDGAL